MSLPISKSLQKLGKVAAVLGIVQGFVWAILAIVGIAEHYTDKLYYLDSHSEILSFTLHLVVKFDFDLLNLDGTGLVVVMFLYLVLSLCWLFASVLLHMRIKKSEVNGFKTAYITWGAIGLITCIYDLIVFGLLVSDYVWYRDIYNFVLEGPFVYVLLSYGVLFTVAARGYVLWIINFAVSLLILKTFKQLSSQQRTGMNTMDPRMEFDSERNNGQHLQQNAWLSNQGYTSSPTTHNYIYPSQENTANLNYPPTAPNTSQLPSSSFNRQNDRY